MEAPRAQESEWVVKEQPAIAPVTVKAPNANEGRNFLIMVRTNHDDISWVTAYVPVRYTVRAYVADSDDATYHPLINKGQEAMSYLQYVIDNYGNLPDTSTFIHAHQFAIHNNPVFGNDMIQMLHNLNPEVVYKRGYINLNCNKDPGCTETFSDRMTKEPVPMHTWFAEAWPMIFPGETLPEMIAAPCCAQFSVTRDRIRKRPLAFYVRARNWLVETEMNNYYSSRLFEYIWHYIFGANAHHCPMEMWCYCELYDKCFPSVDIMQLAKRIGSNLSIDYEDRASAIDIMCQKEQ